MAYIDAKLFGVKGDGVADDTKALQAALDEGARTQTCVFLDGGVYTCGMLKMPPHTGLVAEPVWSYRESHGAILKLNDANAKCHIDVTGAFGSTLNGVFLQGGHIGKNIHGVMLDNKNFSKQEETLRFERCRISEYSGDGVHLDKIWVYSMRFCMISFNKRHGIYSHGWDIFFVDNWLSGNGGAGYYTDITTDKGIFTGNRIEWNKLGGFVFKGGDMLNITGNCFDHNFGPGILFTGDSPNGGKSGNTFTGNIFERNGADDEHKHEYYDSQIYIENQSGITMTGNVYRAGFDDQGKGRIKPSYGIVYKNISHSIIANNSLHHGASKELITDLGGCSDIIVKDNVGVCRM